MIDRNRRAGYRTRIFLLLPLLAAPAAGIRAQSAPTDILLDPQPARVSPGATAGTSVGTLTAVDPDAGDTHTFTIVAATDVSVAVEAGSEWRYRDTGEDLGTAWREPGFDDAAWASGPARLGYGGDGEVTTIGFGPDPDAKHITTYFRRTFEVADPAALSGLLVELQRDDGAAVYINGNEVARDSLPEGDLSFDTEADATAGGANEDTFFPFPVDLAVAGLVAGTNVIAVEVHQADPGSSDLTFDLRLSLEQAGATFDNAAFAIEGDQLVTAGALGAAEGAELQVNVRAEDGDGGSVERVLTVTVTANGAPTAADQSFTIDENAPAGAEVGTVAATDPDGDALTFTVTGGDPGGAFAIDPATGSITVDDAGEIDFETAPSFALTVEVSDAGATPLTVSATVTVDLNDLNEAPVLADANFDLATGAGEGTVVGVVAAVDPDAGDVVSYAFSAGNEDGAFAIGAFSGEITLVDPGAAAPGGDPFIEVTVTASDSGDPALSDEASVSIAVSSTLVAEGQALTWRVPEDGAEDGLWFLPGFDDAAWTAGVSGLGYETNAGYEGEFATDVEAAMDGVNASIYARLPFTVDDTDAVGTLELRVKYDDGFIAYLNGVEVARRNAPDDAVWNSTATGGHSDALAVQFEAIDLGDFIGQLVNGENLLAVHGLNTGPNGSDFLLVPVLSATAFGSPAFPNPADVAAAQAAEVTATSALVQGSVLSTGGARPAVTLAWGEIDGGADPDGWEQVVDLGPVGRGDFAAIVSGLQPETRYFYSFFAANAAGASAAPASATFVTTGVPRIDTVLVEEGADARVRVPVDAGEAATWFERGFNAGAWTAGTTGVGYERSAGYEDLIGTNVEAEAFDINATVYVRIPFEVEDPGAFDRLELRMKYDDGFAAYLNGREIAQRNAPGALAWNSTATASHPDGDAVEGELFDLTPFLGELRAGTNVLALQGLNESADGSDLLVLPRLVASVSDPAGVPPAPSVTSEVATSVGSGSADANADLSGGGGRPLSAVLLWGETDGGGNVAAWENRSELGVVPAGPLAVTITGLTAETRYQYRFYAYNDGGVGVAAQSQSFTTGGLGAPEVAADEAGDVASDSATLNGRVTDSGGEDPAVTVYWGAADGGEDPAAWDNEVALGARAAGAVALALSGLTPVTDYFYRLRAENSSGTAWSDVATFSTPVGVPGLTLTGAAEIAANTATVGADVLNNGDAPEVFFVWGPTDGGQDPLAWANTLSAGVLAGGGPVAVELTDLAAGTTYLYSAYATNSAGTGWAPAAQAFSTSAVAGIPETVVPTGAVARILVPADDTLETVWMTTDFEDGEWTEGPTGIGYDTSPTYEPEITTDIDLAMRGVNDSVYIRIPFEIDDLATPVVGLTLRMKYDDAFVAYLNGEEIARSDDVPADLTWDATATGTHDDGDAVVFEDFNVSAFIGSLRLGTNVLAIQGLDANNSSDFLIVPELVIIRSAGGSPAFEAWAAGFPGLSGPDAAPGADPDGDGKTNFAEYAFGGDPLDASGDAPPAGGAFVRVGAVRRFDLSYTRRSAFAQEGLTYRVETSVDLVVWQLATVALQSVAPAGDGQTERVTVRLQSPVPPALRRLLVRVRAIAAAP